MLHLAYPPCFPLSRVTKKIEMKRVRLILIVLLNINLISCSSSYELINANKIQGAFILNSSPTFRGYYYQGSDEEFHFFVSKWDLGKDRYFKLKVEDLNVVAPYLLNLKEVRIDLIMTEKIFGKNEFYELYIPK